MMGFLAHIVQLPIPKRLKKKQVMVLFRLTATALDCHVPDMARLSYDELLQAYADFTEQQVSRLIDEGADPGAMKERLHGEALALGRRVRSALRVDGADVYPLVVMLYKNIGIDLAGSIPGEINICRCFFSSTYSPAVCDFMSSLDSGIIEGISGDGRLSFQGRITEGKPFCTAEFTSGQAAQ